MTRDQRRIDTLLQGLIARPDELKAAVTDLVKFASAIQECVKTYDEKKKKSMGDALTWQFLHRKSGEALLILRQIEKLSAHHVPSRKPTLDRATYENGRKLLRASVREHFRIYKLDHGFPDGNPEPVKFDTRELIEDFLTFFLSQPQSESAKKEKDGLKKIWGYLAQLRARRNETSKKLLKSDRAMLKIAVTNIYRNMVDVRCPPPPVG